MRRLELGVGCQPLLSWSGGKRAVAAAALVAAPTVLGAKSIDLDVRAMAAGRSGISSKPGLV